MKKTLKVIAVVVFVLGLGLGVATIKDVVNVPTSEKNLADPPMGG
ncbi:hypothetical protein [Bacillus sp. Bva_UNVM-123]